MNRLSTQPASRLICFGGARLHTNAPLEVGPKEILPPDEYFDG